MDDVDEINNEESIFHNDKCNNDHNKHKEVIKIKNFEIFCYFKIIKENELIYSIQSHALILETQYAYDLIKNIITKINERKKPLSIILLPNL